MFIEADDQFRQFIKEHINDDPVRLRLKYHNSEPWIEHAITHIQCVIKAGKKFNITGTGELMRPEILLSPLSIEQATSADIALFHQSLIRPGDTILDMTMGLGIDTMAMASVKGTDVTSCELSPLLVAAARINFAGYPNITVIETDSVEYLNTTDRRFDVIFIDPARRGDAGQRVYNLHDCTPDLTAILPVMKLKSRRIIAKLSPMLDVTQTLRDLPGTTELYVVDNGTECKELLAVINTERSNAEPEIIVRNRDNEFRYTLDQEHEAQITYAAPVTGGFILEPAPALMKAGPFRLLSSRFGIDKLSANTNLYTSPVRIDEFPGSELKIIDIIEFSSKEIKRFSSRYPAVNITVRNFPMDVDKLYKKLKVKQGGDIRVFAVTTADNQKLLVVTRHI